MFSAEAQFFVNRFEQQRRDAEGAQRALVASFLREQRRERRARMRQFAQRVAAFVLRTSRRGPVAEAAVTPVRAPGC